jgi:excisionase family DNA binding protein
MPSEIVPPIPDGRRTRERRRFFTVPAFAVRLAVHENTVRKWIRAGTLPAYRFPPRIGEWRIRISDAARFEEQARFTVTPNPIAGTSDRRSRIASSNR